MSNYSILQRNTLDGFSETAQVLYLKLTDVFQGNERKAFAVASFYENRCGNVLDYIMRNSPAHQLDARTISQLSAFFAERWRHNFMERAA